MISEGYSLEEIQDILMAANYDTIVIDGMIGKHEADLDVINKQGDSALEREKNSGIVSDTVNSSNNISNRESDKSFLENIGSGIVDFVGSISDFVTDLPENASQAASSIANSFVDAFDDLKNAAIEFGEDLASINSIEDVGNVIRDVFSTGTVLGMNVVESIDSVLENAIDGAAMVVSDNMIFDTAIIYDCIQFVKGDQTYGIDELVKTIEKGYSDIVRTDHVGNAIEEFWNSDIGETLDNNSYLSHEGAFSQLERGTLEVAANVALDFLGPTGIATSVISTIGDVSESSLQNGDNFKDSLNQGLVWGLADLGLSIIPSNIEKVKGAFNEMPDVITGGLNKISGLLDDIHLGTKIDDIIDSVGSFTHDIYIQGKDYLKTIPRSIEDRLTSIFEPDSEWIKVVDGPLYYDTPSVTSAKELWDYYDNIMSKYEIYFPNNICSRTVNGIKKVKKINVSEDNVNNSNSTLNEAETLKNDS